MSFSSNELNYIIWRYLKESGFIHTAYLFSQESAISEAEINTANVAQGALTTLIQKGLYYVEAQIAASGIENGETDKERASRSLLETLSLVEASRFSKLSTDFVPSRKQARAIGNSNAVTSPRVQEQRERDREARGGSIHNGLTRGGREKTSPKSNGLGVHTKKQQAAQQAAALTNGSGTELTNGMRNDDLMHFPEERVRYLKCHSSEVFICAWNPMSDLMASGSGDSTGRIWDLTGSEDPSTSSKVFETKTHVLKHCLSGDDKEATPTNKDVTSLDWNCTGEALATGCYDGCARVWSRDGRLKCTLGSHTGPIFALKWNHGGNYILSAGVDKTTVVWDPAKGSQVQVFQFHTASALDVDWISEDTFASCSTDKTIHVCKIGLDRPVRTYLGHQNEVNAIKYDPHSKRLASCSDDMTLKVWSLNDDKPVHDWKAHEKEIYSIRWSPRGHIVASASFDHSVRLWDVQRGEMVRSLTRHADPVYSVSFSPDGRYLASGCFDRSVFIWDVNSGKLLQSYVGDKSQGGIFEVSWNARGDKVAASASDGTVILMDVRHLKNKII